MNFLIDEKENPITSGQSVPQYNSNCFLETWKIVLPPCIMAVSRETGTSHFFKKNFLLSGQRIKKVKAFSSTGVASWMRCPASYPASCETQQSCCVILTPFWLSVTCRWHVLSPHLCSSREKLMVLYRSLRQTNLHLISEYVSLSATRTPNCTDFYINAQV